MTVVLEKVSLRTGTDPFRQIWCAMVQYIRWKKSTKSVSSVPYTILRTLQNTYKKAKAIRTLQQETKPMHNCNVIL
jgi:hypothetical protein